MSEPFAVEVVRNDVVESVHFVDVAVVDRDGSIVREAGEPRRIAYFRSSLKPVQAAVSIAEGWKPGSDAEVAIACSSHNGEPDHLEVVRKILSGAGLDENALRCPPALPMLDTEAARAGSPKRIFRDCSGKHAAFLAASVARGWPLETYLNIDHPIQHAIAARVVALCGGIAAVGVDGCGAPTFAAPLDRIAAGFGANALGEPDVSKAMRAHPFLVAGTRRVCTALLEAPSDGLVVKAGAEGMLCFASTTTGLAGALKVRDGTARAVPPAAVAVIAALGLVRLGEDLAPYASPPVLGGGRPEGFLRVKGWPA